MNSRESRYVDVDRLQAEARLEEVLAFYGVDPGPLQRTGAEVRTRCFLACGREDETGERALAIRVDDPVKRWHCHRYGCGRGGNLVSLCDLMKDGPSGDGRPRGERFKAIRDDLVTIVEGVVPVERTSSNLEAKSAPEQPTPKRNVPLVRSENERARALVDLDEKFVTDVSVMPPAAARYFRERPFLTPEACRAWRIGYLPRNTSGDRSGGTMRGRIVYGYRSVRGEILTWFGRDPEFERRHRAWVEGGRQGREPVKTQFVKGFSRGLELYGQQEDRLTRPGYREALAELGLVVVEGPNDVVALDALGVPAVALCGNTLANGQVEKLAAWANELANGTVTLMLDADPEGVHGANRALPVLAERCRVRLAWSDAMHGGRFRGRQPESLSPEEWSVIREHLTR